jgi:hypothetical protein
MFKPILVICTVLVIALNSTAQQYWQQALQYNINVSLNDKTHVLTGDLKLVYTNNSPNELSFIWFHVWPNAYKNTKTALFKQLESLKGRSGKLSNVKSNGSIDGLAFKVEGKLAKTEAHPEHIDIVKLVLNKPLASGASITITTPFSVTVPDYFSRLGHNGNYYMITQWYPKPAVYDAKGWHEMPYLDQGEFYSDYGNFDVNITLPSQYIVAGTGELQTKTELDAYKKSGSENRKLFDDAINKGKGDFGINNLMKTIQPVKVAVNAKATQKTLRFTQNNVHDFAWFACKDFVVQYQPFTLTSGKTIDAFTFHYPDHSSQWYNSSNFCKDAVTFYSENVGEYEYSTVKAVEGPKNQSSGGMEYPTVTLITSPEADQKALDGVITHEVGHNWFYSILGSNEREEAFLDEGLNTYYQLRYEAIKYRACSFAGPNLPAELTRLNEKDFANSIYSYFNENAPGENAINTKCTAFTNDEDYGLVIYIKTAVWMHLMERKAGREALDGAMKAYYNTWKNKHPQIDNFKEVFSTKLASYNVIEWLELMNKKGVLTFY